MMYDKDMKLASLTPFESMVFEALKISDGPLTFDAFDKLQLNRKSHNNNRYRVYIKALRKAGIKVENVRGVGYMLQK